MTQVVNLNKHRRAKATSEAKAQAAENRIRFGRTKVEKAFDAARAGARAPLARPPSAAPEQD